MVKVQITLVAGPRNQLDLQRLLLRGEGAHRTGFPHGQTRSTKKEAAAAMSRSRNTKGECHVR